MKYLIIVFFLYLLPHYTSSQGLNNTWLLGNSTGWPNLGRIEFESSSYQLLTEQRKMTFTGTQGTISDENGNLLMSSNGIWIANANNDTMLNGSGLNPGYFTNGWSYGLPIIYGNVFIPYPSDSNKYLLIHETELSPSYIMGIYSSVIDITLAGGLGEVIQKNDSITVDTLSYGIAAVQHANGEDWWIVAMKDTSDIAYTILITSNGIDTITKQSLSFSPWPRGNVPNITFSQDGKKFISTTYDNPIDRNCSVILTDFDRCSGLFSNTQVIPVSSGSYLWGLAFSPSGQFVYTCTSNYLFQINTTTLTLDTVAMYDGFISGMTPNCCATTFMNMYLAANGKIYITSGSSVKHIHEMNYPDSAGLACDVQQHNISLGNYLHFRAIPNHPNYYLGCDTTSSCPCLTTGVEEPENHDFKFSVSPNPNNGNFNIMYLLPHPTTGSGHGNGKLEVYDVNGRRVFEMNLPPWSTMQSISIPSSVGSGVYNCVIVSSGERVNRKMVVFNEK